MKKNNLFSVLLLSSSTFIIGVISYMYHPIMIRHLSIADFADFESLLSLMHLLSVLVMAISLFLVKTLSRMDTRSS
jgi:O-antigen/teichoic acid export membrane protein